MKLDWLTDPHLDHLPSAKELASFFDALHERDSDGLILTGDIAESTSVAEFLGLLSGAYQRPIYFVLGNHDFYGDWMTPTKERVRRVCKACPPGILNWSTDCGVVYLNKTTALIGHDGIYDGQCGLGVETPLNMTDFKLGVGIYDLAEARQGGPQCLFEKLLVLAQLSAAHVESYIRECARGSIQKILILTHVPPFREASYFRGKISNDKSAPFYVNKTMGDMLRRVVPEFPGIQFDVYAGHTHGKRHYKAESNLDVYVGSARYEKQPQFQTPIEI